MCLLDQLAAREQLFIREAETAAATIDALKLSEAKVRVGPLVRSARPNHRKLNAVHGLAGLSMCVGRVARSSSFFFAGSLYGLCRRSSSARTSCWRSKRTQTGAMSEGKLRFGVMNGAYALGTEGSAGWNIGGAAGHAPCARILTPHRDVRIRAGGCAGVCAYTRAHELCTHRRVVIESEAAVTDISELHQRNQTLMRMLQEEQACAPLAFPARWQCSATRCAAQRCAQNGGAGPHSA